jgi:hypothetical protein
MNYYRMPANQMQPYMQNMPQATDASPFMQQLYPTGIPTGPAYAPLPVPVSPASAAVPGIPASLVTISSTDNPLYTAGFLKTQIGQKVLLTFLIGSNSTVDRQGTLLGVGTSYIIIRESETDDLMLCDMYSIKFVRIYH